MKDAPFVFIRQVFVMRSILESTKSEVGHLLLRLEQLVVLSGVLT